jgi:hypothetical protein
MKPGVFLVTGRLGLIKGRRFQIAEGCSFSWEGLSVTWNRLSITTKTFFFVATAVIAAAIIIILAV